MYALTKEYMLNNQMHHLRYFYLLLLFEINHNMYFFKMQYSHVYIVHVHMQHYTMLQNGMFNVVHLSELKAAFGTTQRISLHCVSGFSYLRLGVCCTFYCRHTCTVVLLGAKLLYDLLDFFYFFHIFFSPGKHVMLIFYCSWGGPVSHSWPLWPSGVMAPPFSDTYMSTRTNSKCIKSLISVGRQPKEWSEFVLFYFLFILTWFFLLSVICMPKTLFTEIWNQIVSYTCSVLTV